MWIGGLLTQKPHRVIGHAPAPPVALAGIAVITWSACSKLMANVDRTKPRDQPVVPPETAFDEIRWFRGRRLYLENCASCHGANGEPAAAAVKFDAEGYPVPPRSFVSGIFKGGSAEHQIYARLWKGMKGTPMPASEGVCSGDEAWDIIHYVRGLSLC